MISNLEIVFDLEENTKAVILKKTSNPKSGDKLKVYIPRLMRGIDKGKPKIKISPVQYRGAFANASECRPIISNTLREQNYMTGLWENNSGSKSVVKVVYNEEQDMSKAYIPEESEVRCAFINGKLSQLRLNTNDNMDYTANEYIYDQFVLKSDLGEDEEDEEDDIIEEVEFDEDPLDSTDIKKSSTKKSAGGTDVQVTYKSIMGTKIRSN